MDLRRDLRRRFASLCCAKPSCMALSFASPYGQQREGRHLSWNISDQLLYRYAPPRHRGVPVILRLRKVRILIAVPRVGRGRQRWPVNRETREFVRRNAGTDLNTEVPLVPTRKYPDWARTLDKSRTRLNVRRFSRPGNGPTAIKDSPVSDEAVCRAADRFRGPVQSVPKSFRGASDERSTA
jgi:hypothetical protein